MTIFGSRLERFSIAVVMAGLAWACQPEYEEISGNPDIKLKFSTDTIHFDTVFASLGSITKRFKVYNPSKNAVKIENISLGALEESPFNIYINGIKGKSFAEQLLLGNDSLLVLVEVFIDPNNNDLPLLVTDSIRFLTNGNLQDVKLLCWGQDAFFAGKIALNRDTTWSPAKPVVLLDTVVVGNECTLTIADGTRIYAHPKSALAVIGSLKIEGKKGNPVVFSGLRADMSDGYGQWGGILFARDSKKSNIDFCTIRNAFYGIYLGTPDDNEEPDLVLSNIIIQNAIIGLISFSSDIWAVNLLIENCAEHLVVNVAGGSYYYSHCTFSNSNAGLQIVRKKPALVFSNYYPQSGGSLHENFFLEIHNSILWGNLQEEIHFDTLSGKPTEIFINHSLLKTRIEGLQANNNLINVDPMFADFRNHDFTLKELSPAINTGDPAHRIPIDLSGNERGHLPDMGAYEKVDGD